MLKIIMQGGVDVDKQAFCHWISVDDALPDAGDRVIATDGDFVGEAYMVKRAGNSPNWMRHYGCSWVGGDVIAWVPMPLYDQGGGEMHTAPSAGSRSRRCGGVSG